MAIANDNFCTTHKEFLLTVNRCAKCEQELERKAALCDELAEALRCYWAGVSDNLREKCDKYIAEMIFTVPVMAGGLVKTKAALAKYDKLKGGR